MWIDDVKEWTVLKDYEEVKRNAEDCDAWVHKKMTHDDEQH